MLEDQDFTERFFAKNHALMAENYALLTAILDEHDIPYYKNGYARVCHAQR
jgi:hypothetical protein